MKFGQELIINLRTVGQVKQPGRSGNGFIVARHSQLTYLPNTSIQRTRATKRRGIFRFCGGGAGR